MEILNFAILLVSLFGYCAFFIHIKLCKPSAAPLYTLCAIGIAATIGAMLRLLLPFTYALYTIGIVLLIYTVIACIIKHKFKEFILSMIDPGIIIFFVLSLVFFWICRGVLCYSHDEFSHWALHPSYLLMYDKLPPDSNVVPFYTLPPIASIIEYYFARFLKYQEGMMYYAQTMFLISAIVASCINAEGKKSFKSIIFFLLGFTILIKYCVFDFFNLYTDTLMALLAGSAYVCYLHSNKKQKDILKLSPIIFAIPLVRESSPTFAIFVVLLILADQIVLHGVKLKAVNIKDFIKKNSGILSVIILFAVIALSIFAWNIYLSSIDTPNIYHLKTHGNHKNFEETYIYAISFFDNLSYTSVGSYLGAFKFISTVPYIYLIQITMLAIVYFMMEYKNENRVKKQIITYGITITFIFAAFIIGLMYAYLNRFGEPEADVFASMSRYMSSISILTLFTTVNVIISIANKTESNIIRKILIFLLTVMVFVNISTTTITRLELYETRVHSYIGTRHSLHDMLSKYKGRFNEDEKVFVVAQGYEEGITPYLYHFELMANTNDKNYNLTIDNFLSIDEFSQILVDGEYDYLINSCTDEFFINTYGALFNELSDEVKLYKVDLNGEYLLTSID